jgi:hypothetical protein
MFLFKSAIDSYYTIQFKKCDAALLKLEKSKETKLDELMAKTNFKATQQLISQFSEKKKPQQPSTTQQPSGSPSKQQMGQQPGRPVAPPSTPATGRFASHTVPASAFKLALQQQQQQQHQQQQQQHFQQQQQFADAAASLPPTPSDPLAGSSRTSLDKIVDFILGEGPNNKYALLCHACSGHNGLVREQELGKIRFKCAMCGAFNGPPMPPQGTVPPMTPAATGSGAAGIPFTPASSSSAAAPLTPFAPLARDSERRNDVEEAPKPSPSPSAPHDERAEMKEDGGVSPEEEEEPMSVEAADGASASGAEQPGSEHSSDAEGSGSGDGKARKRKSNRS